MTQLNKELPSQESLNEVFSYDPNTGVLRYKIPRGHMKVGDVAGQIRTQRDKASLRDFRVVSIKGKGYTAARLIWKMMTGDDPMDLEIDHINVDPLDDRWENLRLSNNPTQGWNRPKSISNTSGYKGVDFHKGYWRARIRFGNKGRFTLGETFKTKEEAGEAYAIAAEALHQEFKNLN